MSDQLHMNRGVAALACVLLITSLTASAGWATPATPPTTVYVGRADCSDSTGLLGPDAPSVCSLSRALGLAGAGTRIVLAPGRYQGPLRPPSGAPGSPTIVTAPGGATVVAPPGDVAAKIFRVHDVVVSGVSFMHGRDQGVWAAECARVRFVGVTISRNAGPGLQVKSCRNLTVQASRLINNGAAGIHEVGGNVRTTYVDSLVAYNGKDPAPYNGDGIQLDGHGATVRNTRVIANGSHPKYEHGIYASRDATGYTIVNSVVRGSSGTAIKASGAGRIISTRLTGTGIGVYISDSTAGGVTLARNYVAGRYAHGVLASTDSVATLKRNRVRVYGQGVAVSVGAGARRVVLRSNSLRAKHRVVTAGAASTAVIYR